MSNQEYLEKLKNEKEHFELEGETIFAYPNIQELSINNDYLTYKTYQLNINGLELYLLDPILFKFEVNEILFVLKNSVINLRQPDFIDKEIEYLYYLEKLDELNDENKQYIFKYMDDFYKKQNIVKKYNYDELRNEINERILPISAAYLDEEDKTSNYHKPAAYYIRHLDDVYNETQRETTKMSYSGPRLVRTDGSIRTNSYEIDSWSEAGFTNTLILVGTTLAIGIGLAVFMILR